MWQFKPIADPKPFREAIKPSSTGSPNNVGGEVNTGANTGGKPIPSEQQAKSEAAQQVAQGNGGPVTNWLAQQGFGGLTQKILGSVGGMLMLHMLAKSMGLKGPLATLLPILGGVLGWGHLLPMLDKVMGAAGKAMPGQQQGAAGQPASPSPAWAKPPAPAAMPRDLTGSASNYNLSREYVVIPKTS
jgi:hypothetical protein